MIDKRKGESAEEVFQRRLRKEQKDNGPEWRDGFMTSIEGGATTENPYPWMEWQFKLWVNGWARGEEFKTEIASEGERP